MDKPAYRSMFAMGSGVERPASEWMLLFFLRGTQASLYTFAQVSSVRSSLKMLSLQC